MTALWGFIFADPTARWQSCRISAPTRADAVAITEAYLGRPVVTQPNPDPAKRVIVQNIGRTKREVGLVSAIERSGAWYETKQP